MANIYELEWENQNGVSNYPFMVETQFQNLIVDAKFQQYDNFVPILNYILVSATSITLNITYDTNTNNFTLTQTNYNNN